MIRTCLLSGFAVLTLLSGTAAAQNAGGIQLGQPGMNFINPAMALGPSLRQPIGVAPPARSQLSVPENRKALHQQMVARIRGDAGFLAGYFHGQPLAASRQPPPPVIEPSVNFFQNIEAPFIINNFESAINLDFGQGNITQQQVANSNGDIVQNQAADQAGTFDIPEIEEVGATAGGIALPPLVTVPLEAAARLERVEINNANSAVNLAVGKGNTASQQIMSVR